MPPGVETWVWVADFRGFGLVDCDPRLAKIFLDVCVLTASPPGPANSTPSSYPPSSSYPQHWSIHHSPPPPRGGCSLCSLLCSLK
jgi:hypothetical protein